MIRLDPNGLYSASDVVKMTGWHPETVRRLALRTGKKKGAVKQTFWTAEELRRALTEGK